MNSVSFAIILGQKKLERHQTPPGQKTSNSLRTLDDGEKSTAIEFRLAGANEIQSLPAADLGFSLQALAHPGSSCNCNEKSFVMWYSSIGSTIGFISNCHNFCHLQISTDYQICTQQGQISKSNEQFLNRSKHFRGEAANEMTACFTVQYSNSE